MTEQTQPAQAGQVERWVRRLVAEAKGPTMSTEHKALLDALWRGWEEKSEEAIRDAYNAPRNTSERTRHEERSEVFHVCADELREALERLGA